MTSRTAGRALVHGSAFNLAGQSLPLVVGLFCIPIILHGYDTVLFGLLAIVWTLLTNFAIFDFGVSRALTRHISASTDLAHDALLARIVATAIALQAVIALVVTTAFWLLTPLLITRVLKIPAELHAEAGRTFFFLMLCIPLILLTNTFRAILEAANRFDLVNLMRVPFNSLNFIVPAVAVDAGWPLSQAMVGIFVTRAVMMAVHAFVAARAVPAARGAAAPDVHTGIELLRFGGWVSISNLSSPILVYGERFVLSSMLTLSAVAYYSAPSEIVTRLLIIPSSVAMTLFPALSSLDAADSGSDFQRIFGTAHKFLLLALIPFAVVILAFSHDILLLWLGADAARNSTTVLQILTFGIVANSFGHLPFTALHASGRPDMPAKFHMLEIPVHVVVLWLCVREFGIAGAALAWTVRALLDMTALYFGVAYVAGLSVRRALLGGAMPRIYTGAAVLLASALTAAALPVNVIVRLGVTFAVCVVSAVAAWFYVLTESERGVLMRALRRA